MNFSSLLSIIAWLFLLACAGNPPSKKAPYMKKEFQPHFDFSTLKKGTRFYIKHQSGIYYNGEVNIEKSGPGYLCLYQGEGTRCFVQEKLLEITGNSTTNGVAKTLLVNLGILAVFFALIYFLPTP